MSIFDDLVASQTLASVKATIISYAQSAGLRITDWIVGSVGEQLFQGVSQSTYAYVRVAPKVIRGFVSLDTATDPGDVDPYDDANEDLEPESGFLSAFGENTFGTVRDGETFASGFVTFTNGGSQARSFAPEALTFTWTENTPPSPAPTYRNAADASIYVNPDGTVTVGAGSSLVIPVTAEEIGTGSNAPASSLSLTTSLQGCTATNAAAVLGTGREDADDYRARCRQAASRISLGGPMAAYAYLASTNLDGTPLQNASDNDVGITRVYVSSASDTGIVLAYYATDSGAATAEDVTAANENIEADAFAVPDAITFTGAAATEVEIHVVGTGKVRARTGLTAAQVKAAIVDALTEEFSDFPIGGFDQTDGAGVIYTRDLEAIAARAFAGLYDVTVSTPAGATTALDVGEVATLDTVAGDWTITVAS